MDPGWGVGYSRGNSQGAWQTPAFCRASPGVEAEGRGLGGSKNDALLRELNREA